MRKAGTFFMVIGAALLLAALALFALNQREDTAAAEAVVEVVPQLVEQIRENTARETAPAAPELLVPEELLTAEDVQMEEVKIGGNGYIGYLSIPRLELELPILGSWSYPKLQIAPCRFTGSIKGGDLVLMAHNYSSHFGRISNLSPGDQVRFTDADGAVHCYEVVLEDLLEPTAVEEVISGDFDLTLFTCTYGGGSRIVVYCDRVAE